MLFKSLSLLFILLICCFIMPGGKTNFKSDWLLKTDAQGNKISSWCKQHIALFVIKHSVVIIKVYNRFCSMQRHSCM